MQAGVPFLTPDEKYVSMPTSNENVQVLPDGYGTFGEAKVKLYGSSESENESSQSYLRWDFMTSRLAEFATIPFLLMQIPQVILNTQNLLDGNASALFAVQWMAQLTSLMGNLSLLSYFVSKKERGAIIVQAVGVLSTLIVLLQLAIAGAMPLPVFVATVVACLIGFIVNSFNYKNLITEGAWKVWIEVIGIGGAYVLTQVIWSTFVPYLPKSELPGIIAAAILLILIELARWGLLPDAIMNIVGGISGWTATLLFMWSPVSQLYTNIRNPANIQGLSIFTVLLAMIGNGMLMPRALFIRDLMWFTGSSWGSSVQGWGILLSMYIYKAASSYVFWGVTCVFASWLGAITLGDMYAYSLTNPIAPIIELFKRKRQYEIPK